MSRRINRDDVDKWHDSGLYIPTRHVYMGSEHSDSELAEGGCDYLMAEKIIKNLHVLESINKEPITILMNNLGGDKYHGLAIYDAIRLCESRVIIKVLGHAMSMGSIILQAADERLMAATSRQMVHYGTWGHDDHAKTYQKWAQEGLKYDKWMESMYLAKIQEKHPIYTLEDVQKMLNHDTIMTASESVKMGLCDKVLGGVE